jgi:hypothetical protein
MLLQPLGQKLAVNFLYLSPTFNILPFFEAYSVIPPPVTITADDKRLKAGKPAHDLSFWRSTALDTIQKNSKILQAVFIPASPAVLL